MKSLICTLGLILVVRQSVGIEQTTALRRALLHGYERDAKPDGKVETRVGLRVTTLDLCAHRQVIVRVVEQKAGVASPHVLDLLRRGP